MFGKMIRKVLLKNLSLFLVFGTLIWVLGGPSYAYLEGLSADRNWNEVPSLGSFSQPKQVIAWT